MNDLLALIGIAAIFWGLIFVSHHLCDGVSKFFDDTP